MKSPKYLIVIIALTFAATWCMNTSAKNKRMPKAYMFGMAASFNDSTVYFTDIQEVDSVWINDKNKFLLQRSDYSYQLKNHLEAQGMSRRTCIVSYALKRKELEKKYVKMKNKYAKNKSLNIKYIDNTEFLFTSVNIDE